MNEVIKRIDGGGGMRFYEGVTTDQKTKQEVRNWVYTSVTSKLDAVFPKGAYLIKWIRDNGAHGMAEFEKAAEKGTETHVIINRLLQGESVPTIDLDYRVLKCVQSFIDFYNEVKPETLATEHIVVNHEEKYAGACDWVCKIDYTKGKTVIKGTYVIDFKTSSALYQSHELQNVAYLKALPEEWQDKAGLLHLGNRTKLGWSFKDLEIDSNWKLFQHFNETFAMMNPNAHPDDTIFPELFQLTPQDNGQNNA